MVFINIPPKVKNWKPDKSNIPFWTPCRCYWWGVRIIKCVAPTPDTTPAPVPAPAPAPPSGSCPYSKDNLSWGEYQVTIPMESSVSSASIVLTFDAETTIVQLLYFQNILIFWFHIFREVVTVVVLLHLVQNAQDLFAQFLTLEVHFNCSM